MLGLVVLLLVQQVHILVVEQEHLLILGEQILQLQHGQKETLVVVVLLVMGHSVFTASNNKKNYTKKMLCIFSNTKHFINQKIKKTMQKELKILVVDDDDVQHLILGRQVKKIPSFKIHTTHLCSGEESIELLSKYPKGFEVILLDIDMPKVNGFEVIEYIRKEIKSNVLVIAHTNYFINKNDYKKAGFDAYLKKNFDIQELQDILEEAILENEKISL
jgi:CheY-like chemotaxis protein